MRYDQKQFTQQGLNLFTNALSQKQSITIDKVIMDNLPTSNLSNLALLTLDDFANAQSFPANYTKVDNNMLTVDSVISNQGFTNSYSANEIGLVGHTEGNSDETLIAILVASDPFVLPAQQNGETPLHLIPNVTIQLANNDMQQVPVDTAQDAYVPQNRLDELVSQHNYVKLLDADSRYVKQDDFNHKVNDAVNNKADKSDLSNLQSSVNESIEPKLDAKANQSDLESTNDTINSLDITNQDGKLMHAGKPLLTANTPNAPSLSLSIDSNNNNVQYTITPPSIDGGASITNYTLMYQAQGDNGWQTRTLDTSSLVGEFTATQSQTYQAYVTAQNYVGTSQDSVTQSILSASVPTITNFSITNNYPNGINWSVNTNDNGSVIDDYIVYYKRDTDDEWQNALNNQSNGNVSALEGNNYVFNIKAHNAVGYSNDNYKNIKYFNSTTLDYGIQVQYGINAGNNIIGTIALNSKIQDIKSVYPNVKLVQLIYRRLSGASHSDINSILSDSYDTIQSSSAVFSMDSIIKGISTNIGDYSYGGAYPTYIILLGLSLDGSQTGINSLIKLDGS